jgi:hypothetical protein
VLEEAAARDGMALSGFALHWMIERARALKFDI